MSIDNPYYHHPQPAAKLAADDVLLYISQSAQLKPLFAQGKMLGVLVVEAPSQAKEDSDAYTRVHYINMVHYLAAYSGVVNGMTDVDSFFVPPIYNLQEPDDFYLLKDAEISAINQQLQALQSQQPANKQEQHQLQKQILALKQQRKEMSIALQKEIFSHFNICNPKNQYRNIIDVFADAKRGLPPGGSGECAAPRLFQYAYQHGLKPLELVEFWFGTSPRSVQRVHRQFYPSCIEKCSPILSYQLSLPLAEKLASVSSDDNRPLEIIYEDDHLLVVLKPKGLLSVPSKDLDESNVETILHNQYPSVKGPMLTHRLDQATSGLLLAAKDADTHKALQQQFEQKTIQKRYVATVQGKINSSCGVINLPLTVNPDDRPRQVVDWQFGKPAVTYYEVISADDYTTQLALYPLTGRTHQLRVHCASTYGLDSCIVGDSLYDFTPVASAQNKCLRLHAESIEFTHPVSGERLKISRGEN